MTITRIARFLDNVWIPTDKTMCWRWIGQLNNHGYGQSGIRVRVGDSLNNRLAHRIIYQLIFGNIPDGLVIDHLCRNRACVNPYHLEPVPMTVNTLRGEGPTAYYARRDSCKWGHLFDDRNTRMAGNARLCKTCQRRSTREYMARKRAAARAMTS